MSLSWSYVVPARILRIRVVRSDIQQMKRALNSAQMPILPMPMPMLPIRTYLHQDRVTLG